LRAPLSARIAAVRDARKLSEADARRHIEKADRERAAFVHAHFGGDPGSPTAYDLILNTERLAVTDCAEVIVPALKRFRAAVVGRTAAAVKEVHAES
jgi:hypothetical protein